MDLFSKNSLEKKEDTQKESMRQPSKGSNYFFEKPTLEKGADKALVQDNSMLWMRSLTKGARQNPQNFLFYQRQEMRFKQSEYDACAVVRQCLVKQTLKT